MTTETMPTPCELYQTDETAWLDAMAELIRDGRTSDLDFPHLAEYLEDMARRDRREVNSRLRVLLAHILKWVHQKEMRTPSWRTTVLDQQAELEDLLESGSLRNHAEESLPSIYQKTVKYAANETNLAVETFDAECAWTLDQLLSPDVLSDGD